MMIIIKKNILEAKVLKQAIILPFLFTMVVVIMNYLNSKNYDSLEFVNMAVLYMSIVNIIIAAWIGSFILKDLVEDNSKEVIATYREGINKISFKRLIKFIVYYLILIFIMTMTFYKLYGEQEIMINMKSLFLNFSLEGLVILISSYFFMSFVKAFSLSFSIIISLSLSFYMILNDFTIIIPDKFKNIINFYIDDALIYVNYTEDINGLIKNFLVVIFLIIMSQLILRKRLS